MYHHTVPKDPLQY